MLTLAFALPVIVSAQTMPAIEDSKDVLLERARARGLGKSIEQLMREQNFEPIALEGFYPGADTKVTVAGDIRTRIDWNGTAKVQVRLWNGEHATIRPEQLVELKRRRDLLAALPGINGGPSPTPAEIESDARLEETYPARLRMNSEASLVESPEDHKIVATVPAETVVLSYRRQGDYCLVKEPVNGTMGWIGFRDFDCGLSKFAEVSQVQPAAAPVAAPAQTPPQQPLRDAQQLPPLDDGGTKKEPVNWAKFARPLVLGVSLLVSALAKLFTKSKGDAQTAEGSATASTHPLPPPPPAPGVADRPVPPPPSAWPPRNPAPPPPKPSDAFLYLVERNGQRFGPYEKSELQRYLASGHVLLTDLACLQGSERWQTVAQIVEQHPGYARPALPEPGTRVFVGDKYPYYERKWASLEARRSRVSWNWPAFLFGPSWFAYRKMHSYAWAFIAVLAIDVFSTIALHRELIPAVAYFAMNFLFGMQANGWYKAFVFKRVDEITRENPHDARIEIARRGGTSAGAAIAVSVVFYLLVYLPAVAESLNE